MGLLHDTGPHGDSYGHGTACAGIIRSIASGCELYSVKVLGSRLTGRGTTFVDKHPLLQRFQPRP